MSLYNKILDRSDNYIEISSAIELLALHEKCTYKAVMVMLHYKFDELLCCFKQGKYHEFIDIDNVTYQEYSSFQILNDVKNDIQLNRVGESKELILSKKIKEKINGYFWEKSSFFNLEPMKVIKLFQKTQQKNKINSMSLKKQLKSLDQYISILDAFELIRDKTDLNDDQEIANLLQTIDLTHKTISYNKARYFDGKPIKLYRDCQSNTLTEMDLLLIELSSGKICTGSNDQRLKNFVWEKFDFIFEFKSILEIDLEENQDSTNFEQPSIQHTKPSVEDLDNEIAQLRDLVAKKNERIKELESSLRASNSNLIDMIYDESETNRYAPDLALAIKLWEQIYLINPKGDISHSNKADTWLRKHTGYDTAKKAGSASKIREITAPLVNWSTLRDKAYKR